MSDSISLEKVLKALVSSPDLFNQVTDLCEIMAVSGSDKCSDWHNYTPVYDFLFHEMRDKEIDFFELGIFFGSSVRGWAKYFPKTHIHCGDYDTKTFVTEPNITSHFCDQDDPASIVRLWQEFPEDKLFDIIIEDGKHEFDSNMRFLVGSIGRLKPGGTFIIEDLTHSTRAQFERELADTSEFGLRRYVGAKEMFILDIPNANNPLDNCLLVIRK